MQQVIRRQALMQTGDKTQTVVTDWTITTDWPRASACTVVYIYICSTRLYQPINSLSSSDPPMGPERLIHYITGPYRDFWLSEVGWLDKNLKYTPSTPCLKKARPLPPAGMTAPLLL